MNSKTKLSGIWGDGAVLQRGVVVRVIGTDSAADRVSATIGDERYYAAVRDGIFSIEIPPHKATTGLTLTVEGSERIIFQDICFGDVFMLSGQSNMELPLSRVRDVSAEEIDSAEYPFIRQYRLTAQYVFGPGRDPLLPEASWTRATPGEIEEMSAAGFFFAKILFEKFNVPIGLILNAQGGSSIEAWMPMDVLNRFDDYHSQVEPFIEEGALDSFLEDRERRIQKWYASLASEEDALYPREVPKEDGHINIPSLFPINPTARFSGVVWFFRSFLLEKPPVKEAFLYLGELIDADDTYVNGVWVGNTSYRYPPREYFFEGNILRKGENGIVVRLIIENGKGGFIAEHPYYLESGKERVDLSGSWSYKVGKEAESDGEPCFLAQKIPTGLFRSAILPLAGFSMKGILWYQGESNTGEPDRYDEKFSVMVESWRTALGYQIPIICVELADYIDPINGAEAGWATIQKMQLNAPLKLSLCGVVSAKDLGAPFELHPQFKAELGRRLAEKAFELFYRKED